MKSVLSVLMLVALSAVSSSQQLCTPDQWEGYQAGIAAYYYHGKPGVIKESSKMFYDAKNRRKAVFASYTINGRPYHYQVVVRYDGGDLSGKVYSVNLDNNQCHVKSITTPFKKICIPHTATHVRDFSFGLKKGGIPVSDFHYSSNGHSVNIVVQKVGGSVVPVTETYLGPDHHAQAFEDTMYGDVTPGISNQTVFNIPRQCGQEEEHPFMDFLMRENRIVTL